MVSVMMMACPVAVHRFETRLRGFTEMGFAVIVKRMVHRTGNAGKCEESRQKQDARLAKHRTHEKIL